MVGDDIPNPNLNPHNIMMLMLCGRLATRGIFRLPSLPGAGAEGELSGWMCAVECVLCEGDTLSPPHTHTLVAFACSPIQTPPTNPTPPQQGALLRPRLVREPDFARAAADRRSVEVVMRHALLRWAQGVLFAFLPSKDTHGRLRAVT